MTRALANHCAIITGASCGLGLEIARHYVRCGASILICAREPAPLEQACTELNGLRAGGQSVIALAADVCRPADVALLLEAALAHFGRLDILVNNAGVAGPIGAIEQVDWTEWVRTIEINLMGAALLSRAVLPHFMQAGRGKIVQLSGGGASNPLPMLSAYAASKAAVVRLVETIAEETRRYHIDVNALAPGGLNTRLLEQFLAAGPDIGPALYHRLLQQKHDGGVPLRKGAELAVFLGSRASDGISGKLISAVWDPWEALPAHLEDLARSDIYTLRRIVPADRELAWEDGT